MPYRSRATGVKVEADAESAKADEPKSFERFWTVPDIQSEWLGVAVGEEKAREYEEGVAVSLPSCPGAFWVTVTVVVMSDVA